MEVLLLVKLKMSLGFHVILFKKIRPDIFIKSWLFGYWIVRLNYKYQIISLIRRKIVGGSKAFHTYLPKVDNSYLILKHLNPGNYKFRRVSQSKNPKIEKNIYSNDFILVNNTITIIQDKFNYTQSE